METLLLGGIALLMASLLLLVLEAFVPSGGLIAAAAALCAVVGCVLLFRHSTTWGMIGVLMVVVMGPISFLGALNMLPHTKLGKRMLGPGAEEIAEERREANETERDRRLALVEREGVARTALRPVGIVLIDGQTLDAIAEGGTVEAGEAVRVTGVSGMEIRVRKA